MSSPHAAKWVTVDLFGQINGVKNVGDSPAEDVLVKVSDIPSPIDREEVLSGEEIAFDTNDSKVSISWRDGSGMHADVIYPESA